MTLAYLGLQVVAGVCCGFTVAQIYNWIKAEIREQQLREKDRMDLRAFIHKTLEEVIE